MKLKRNLHQENHPLKLTNRLVSDPEIEYLHLKQKARKKNCKQHTNSTFCLPVF